MSASQSTAEPDAKEPVRRPFLLLITSHWLSLFGMGLIVTALFTWVFLLPLELRGKAENPYLGLLAFVLVPLVLFSGLAIVPVGVLLARKRLRSRFEHVPDKRAVWSRLLLTFAIITLVNVAVGTQVTYRAVQHMETAQFCGSCHVMAPELAGHRESPHAHIACAECHVGEGPTGWFSSKIAGTRQFFENLAGDVPRPIPSALATDRLVPAKQTCEECHWRHKPGGIRVKVLDSFATDESNTLSQTVLTMHVGGRVLGGIHGAHNADFVIRFAARDNVRQDIVWVEKHDPKTGETRTWLKSGISPQEVEGLKKVTMQCVDCHNRVGHGASSPSRTVDGAMARGELPTTLPYLKKLALELLQTQESQSAAARNIPSAVEAFYQTNHPETWAQRADEVKRAGVVLAGIRNANVFPELAVDWATYPNHLGHTDSTGCFRCHNGDHASPDGRKITNNCFVCHFAAAVDETEPEILQALGLDRALRQARGK